MREVSQFTFRSSRSATLVVAVVVVIAIETVVLHVWLSTSHPRIAWLLTALSVLTAAWIVGDYRAMGESEMEVDAVEIRVRAGWRAVASMPRASVTATLRPTWRERPQAGAPGYLNLTKPSEPNVLLACSPPATVVLLSVVPRQVSTIGLHVDQPDAFVDLLRSATPSVIA